MTGRPTLLTDKRQETIVQAIQLGSYNEQAAVAAGISKRTFHRWMERGANEDRRLADLDIDPTEQPETLNDTEAPYWHFRHAVEKARAQAELAAIAMIVEAGEGYEVRKERRIEKANGDVEVTIETSRRRDWQALAWMLERTRPARYSRRTTVEHSGPEGGAVELSLSEARIQARQEIESFLDQQREIQALPETSDG
jgi:hypothetical protein